MEASRRRSAELLSVLWLILNLERCAQRASSRVKNSQGVGEGLKRKAVVSNELKEDLCRWQLAPTMPLKLPRRWLDPCLFVRWLTVWSSVNCTTLAHGWILFYFLWKTVSGLPVRLTLFPLIKKGRTLASWSSLWFNSDKTNPFNPSQDSTKQHHRDGRRRTRYWYKGRVFGP